MASRIVRLAPLRGSTSPEVGLRPSPVAAPPGHVWRGASGQRYAHAVYSLLECPPLPQAVYLLVHRHPDGALEVRYIASALNAAPTLNLARIRQRGAILAANEVHVHVPTSGTDGCRTIACDLRAGLFGSLGAEPPSPAAR
jgi:hypothetical protein